MKWLKPTDLTKQGTYIFGRTDDDFDWSLILIRLTKPIVAGEEWLRDVRTWDEECRFYGPIPEIEEEE